MEVATAVGMVMDFVGGLRLGGAIVPSRYAAMGNPNNY